MSSYGYKRLTTPHIDRFAQDGVLFEQTFCPFVPTTSAYASMLTGMDVFNAGRRPSPQGPHALRSHNPGRIAERGRLQYDLRRLQRQPCFTRFRQVSRLCRVGKLERRTQPQSANLNEVAIPELERLAKRRKPFFPFPAPHGSPSLLYLPPEPYERMFYHGNECDPKNRSMDPVMSFKPFRDYFATWMPPGITDKDYVIAQYDGAVAYMDAAIQSIFTAVDSLGLAENTIVVVNGDHGETLYDHECYFDHHGLYEPTLIVPLIIRYPGRLPRRQTRSGYNQHKDLVPTLLELAEIESDIQFDGRSLLPMVRDEIASHESEFYITECTWMRKHGWRTPHWKLIIALEPDFHFKPEVELYNLVEDPEESVNLAESRPDVVELLRARMEAWIAQREAETGLPDPIYDQGDWHGHAGVGSFTSSQQAYDTLHIGDPNQAARLQAKSRS